MGGDLSTAQQKHLGEIRKITSSNYFYFSSNGKVKQISTNDIKSFLLYVWENVPKYPEAGSLKLKTWQELGKILHQSPRAPVDILITWRSIILAIEVQEQSLCSLLPVPGDVLPSYSEIQLYTPQPPGLPPDINLANHGSILKNTPTLYPSLAEFQNPSAPISLNLKHQTDSVTAAFRQAAGEGDLSAEELIEANVFPVTVGMDAAMNPVNEWKPLPLRTLKEVKAAVATYGLKSPFTRGLIEAVAFGNRMIPADWRALMNMILTSSQYMVFDHQWRQQALARGTAQVLPDQLYGAGNFATVEQQRDGIPEEGFAIIALCILHALSKVDDKPGMSPSFTTVKQKPSEPFGEFIDRLKAAIEKHIENPIAVEELMLKLAVESANVDCQRILRPLVAAGQRNLAELIQACAVVGSQAYQMEALAAAMRPQGRMGNCFNCGKPGHFKQQCRAPGGGQHKGAGGYIAKPKSLCPKCKRGYHWANQCRYETQQQKN